MSLGIDLNHAPVYLLRHVSGINAKTTESILSNGEWNRKNSNHVLSCRKFAEWGPNPLNNVRDHTKYKVRISSENFT